MTDINRGRNAGQGDRLEQILTHASRRPRPSQRAQERAFEQLHGRWQDNLRNRRSRTVILRSGLAASLVIAVGLVGLNLYNAPGAPQTVAGIVRMSGADATIKTPLAGEQALTNGADVTSGSVITTGAATRLALAWADGGSLRLDEDSRLEFVSESTVRLLAGAMYYDSQAESRDGKAPALTVETRLGSVRHIGTQFMVEAGTGGTTVSVREGQIRFEAEDVTMTVGPGEQVDFDNDGLQAQRQIASYSEHWQWAQAIAPPFPADGQSAADLLTWIARETGRNLVYHGATRRLARQAQMHGITNVGPARALNVLEVATALRFEIIDNEIRVYKPTRDE